MKILILTFRLKQSVHSYLEFKHAKLYISFLLKYWENNYNNKLKCK